MSQYRRRPGVTQAVQVTEENHEAVLEFLQGTGCPFDIVGDQILLLHAKEDVYVLEGDYIVQGVDGEQDLYKLTADVFEASYEPVED